MAFNSRIKAKTRVTYAGICLIQLSDPYYIQHASWDNKQTVCGLTLFIVNIWDCNPTIITMKMDHLRMSLVLVCDFKFVTFYNDNTLPADQTVRKSPTDFIDAS